MVDKIGEGIHLLLRNISWQSWKSLFDSEESTEPIEDTTQLPFNKEAEPMLAYWENWKRHFIETKQPYSDVIKNDQLALTKIPNIPEEAAVESRYNFFNSELFGTPETPKLVEPGISGSGLSAGVIAGIVIAVIFVVLITAALIAYVIYRHYLHRNVTSMNFDNPVYRKTTEDQFALESAQKNGYAPGGKLYPSTVGEEAQEPLNTPGTNDFV